MGQVYCPGYSLWSMVSQPLSICARSGVLCMTAHALILGASEALMTDLACGCPLWFLATMKLIWQNVVLINKNTKRE